MEFPAQVAIELERDVASLIAVTFGREVVFLIADASNSFFSWFLKVSLNNQV